MLEETSLKKSSQSTKKNLDMKNQSLLDRQRRLSLEEEENLMLMKKRENSLKRKKNTMMMIDGAMNMQKKNQKLLKKCIKNLLQVLKLKKLKCLNRTQSFKSKKKYMKLHI